MRYFFTICCLLAFALALNAQTAKPLKSDQSERKIEGIIKKLTLQEKVDMCAGATPQMAFKGVERLGIPNVQCTDGPRGPSRGASTIFPSGLAFGSSWNPELVKEAGRVMGNETRAKGIGVLLGPGNNILRDPLNGRFFEYFTEDPFLNSAITVANVEGVQSEGVAASLKHYACNNREDNRNFYMSMVDDRTMHEIYLPAYKAAVQKAHVWTIMTSANGVNGEFVSDSKKMLTDILKNKWGFDGFTLTDWLQTRSTEKAALAGLDVSMPGGKDCLFGDALLKAIDEGRVPVAIIDDKVRRILRIYNHIGVLDGRFTKSGAAVNTAEHQTVARKAAEEGMVLLKNDGKVLPLQADKIKRVLVIGPNADKKLCYPGGGGSSGQQPPYEVTVLKGIKTFLGDAKVQYLPSDELGGFTLIPNNAIMNAGGGNGFKASYYIKGNEAPVLKRVDANVDFMWEMKSPDASISPDAFAKAHYEGRLIPPMDGKYTLRIIVNGIARVYHGFDGKQQIGFGDTQQTLNVVNTSVDLRKGEPYDIAIDFEKQPGDAAIRLEWELPEPPAEKLKVLDDAAQNADAVIYVAGIDHSMDTEGRDRTDISFPGAQQNILNRLSKLNKNLVTVLVNGSPLELGGWLPNVPAVLEAWYPGMEGGNAVANVLFGKVNPSGKLPFSWPKKLADSPCKVLATENNDIVNYTDSLMVGYRYYDTKNVAPQFPFGYGLSYTSFKYSKLQIAKINGIVHAKLDVTNTGSRDGADVVQLYVKPVNSKVVRPVHELKGFKKIMLKKGETKAIEFDLLSDAFSYYSTKKSDWQLAPGKYQLQIAASSRDIKLAGMVTVLR
ncbi:MAG: glycoside hydrolase family 3 C-terminal domain-containing protein [Mucilaginibacter sp.]|nr:glycoside hydrolase family 3 C-terminal domain-containing protein [Mucilaginibacter sp.]